MKTIKPILVCLALFINLFCYSQNTKWSYHADIGLSQVPSTYIIEPFTFVINPNKFIPKRAFSWSIGTEIEISLTKNIYFASGFNFSKLIGKEVRKWSIMSITNGVFSTTNNTTINEISFSSFSLPLRVKIKKKRFWFSTGIQFSYLIKPKVKLYKKVDNPTLGSEGISNSTIDLDYKNFDVGPIIGSSFELNKRLNIYMDFYLGLINIANNHPSNYSSFWKQKSGRIASGLSFSF